MSALKMVHLAELSRRVGLPYSTLHELVIERRLTPDARAGKFILFDAARVPQLREDLRAMRARARKQFAASRDSTGVLSRVCAGQGR